VKIGARAVENIALAVLLEGDLDAMTAQMIERRLVLVMSDSEGMMHSPMVVERGLIGGSRFTRMSHVLAASSAACRSFAANAVGLQLHALAYNLGNFMRTLAMPKAAAPWSLTSLREKLIKIGSKVVSLGRYVTFQLAEVAVPRQMFQDILRLIARLRVPPAPA
jgi:hypothetical protein